MTDWKQMQLDKALKAYLQSEAIKRDKMINESCAEIIRRANEKHTGSQYAAPANS